MMRLWRWQNPLRAATVRGTSVLKPRQAHGCVIRTSGPAHAASPGAAGGQPAEALERPPRCTSSPAQHLQRFLEANGITATLLQGAAAAEPGAGAGSSGVPPVAAAAVTPTPTTAASAGKVEQPGILSVVASQQQLQQQQGMCHIKSLVFETARGGPYVVVVVLVQDRVDRRRLAQVLGVRAAGVRLAPLGQLPLICGFPAGSVPPLGHQPRLPVVVDSAVTQFSHCIVGAAGSGEGMLCLPVPEVMRVAQATLAAVTVSSSGSLASSDSGWESGSEAQPVAGPAGSMQRPTGGVAAPLPVPWEGDSQRVTLMGLIAQKRKIARLLLFANLVPLPSTGVVPHVAPGSGTYLRRLWQCPQGSGRVVEVQLILGKTLAERLGKEEAARLLRTLKVGDQVKLVGCPQPHATPHGARREAVYDVVVEEIQVIPKQQPEAGAAGTAGSSATPGAAGAAAGSPAMPGAAAGAAALLRKASPAGSSAGGQPRAGTYLQLPPQLQPGGVLIDSLEGLLQLEQALFQGYSSSSSFHPDASPGAASGGSGAEGGGSSGAGQASQGTAGTAGAAGAAGPPATALPPQPAAASGSSALDGTLSNALVDVGYRAVVGMDCEWQPYQRGQPHTPVALLQLAVCWEDRGGSLASSSQLRQQQLGGSLGRGSQQAEGGGREEVFLIDLLALCQSASSSKSSGSNGRGSGWDSGSSGSSSKSGESGYAVPVPAPGGSVQELGQAGGSPAEEAECSSGRQHSELSAEEALLSSILQRLFGDPQLLLVGFKLSHDLQRLCESYPHLPCFGSQGAPVPFRSHVDVMQMANAVLPPAAFARGRGTALSRRLRTGMGLSALADTVLGRRIDKSQQCSDWAARPLSDAQRVYAATDAYALVSLFQQLLQLRRQRQEQLGLPLISASWLATLTAGITDIAAYVPTSGGKERGSGEATPSSSHTPSAGHTSSAHPAPRPASEAVRKQPSRQGSGGGISGTLQLRCNVELLEGQYLGKALSEGGKAAAVRAGAADSAGREPGRTPSFPRGSGLLEWSNAFMLFVNVEPLPAPGQQAQRARYDNRFLWGTQPGPNNAPQPGPNSSPQPKLRQELYITWWPGRGHSPEHPVLRRMGVHSSIPSVPSSASEAQVGSCGQAGSSAQGCGAGGSFPGEAGAPLAPPQQQQAQRQQQQGHPALLLFCRPPGGPYVFCGRRRQAAPPATDWQGREEGSGPGSSGGSSGGCIVWQLQDWPALQGMHAFQRLLAVQGM